jgi:hypothetical protein
MAISSVIFTRHIVIEGGGPIAPNARERITGAETLDPVREAPITGSALKITESDDTVTPLDGGPW